MGLGKELKTTEEHYRNRETKNFYHESRRTRQSLNTKTAYCKDENVQLLGETRGKLNG